MAVHKFDEYELRMAMAEDLELATRWTEADPDHRGRVSPSFWIQQTATSEAWLLYDGVGPVFFFKAVRQGKIIEIHVQFPPASGETQRIRVSVALLKGLRWLEHQVRDFEEIRFDSESPVLVRLCQKHLGFSKDGTRLFKRLEAA